MLVKINRLACMIFPGGASVNELPLTVNVCENSQQKGEKRSKEKVENNSK